MKIIYSTFPNMRSAKKICKKMLEEKLCACVNIFPIKSMYWWKGKIENDNEISVFFKTKKERELKSRIKKLHPYDVPFIGEIDVNANKEYTNII